jgi:hypothetical protein
MRYSLRTLLLLTILGPPVLAWGYSQWDRYWFVQQAKKAVAGAGHDIFEVSPPFARRR